MNVEIEKHQINIFSLHLVKKAICLTIRVMSFLYICKLF